MPTPPATRIGACPAGHGLQRPPSGASRSNGSPLDACAIRRVPSPTTLIRIDGRSPAVRRLIGRGSSGALPQVAAHHRELAGASAERRVGLEGEHVVGARRLQSRRWRGARSRCGARPDRRCARARLLLASARLTRRCGSRPGREKRPVAGSRRRSSRPRPRRCPRSSPGAR